MINGYSIRQTANEEGRKSYTHLEKLLMTELRKSQLYVLIPLPATKPMPKKLCITCAYKEWKV
jgi:hypothetical protein